MIAKLALAFAIGKAGLPGWWMPEFTNFCELKKMDFDRNVIMQTFNNDGGPTYMCDIDPCEGKLIYCVKIKR